MLKGTVIHEIFNLPKYWYEVWDIDCSELTVSKTIFGKHRRQYFLKITGNKSIAEKVVFYFHGGGWMFGSPEQFLQNALVFARQGYTVFMPSYRRIPMHNIAAIKDDLKTSLKMISEEMRTTADSMLMAGMSGGGHLAALCSFDPELIPWTEWFGFSEPTAFLGIGAPLDLDGMPPTPLLRWLAGARGKPLFNAANPILHLNKDSKSKLFILSCGKDGLVPYSAKTEFIKKAHLLGLNPVHHHFEMKSHLEIARWSISGTEESQSLVYFLESI